MMKMEFADALEEVNNQAAIAVTATQSLHMKEQEMRQAETKLTQLLLAYFDYQAKPDDRTASAERIYVERISNQRRLVDQLRAEVWQSMEANYEQQRENERQEMQAKAEKQILMLEEDLRRSLYAQHQLRQESRMLRDRLQHLVMQIEQADQQVSHCQKEIDRLRQDPFGANEAMQQAVTLTIKTEK